MLAARLAKIAQQSGLRVPEHAIVAEDIGNFLPARAIHPTSICFSSGTDVETSAANLKFTVTAIPANGTLKNGTTTLAVGNTFTGSPTSLTYQPNTDYSGPDSFQFKVTDTGDPVGCTPVS